MTGKAHEINLQKFGSKKAVIALYDKQLSELNIDYRDVFVETTFDKTHLIECGNFDKQHQYGFPDVHVLDYA